MGTSLGNDEDVAEMRRQEVSGSIGIRRTVELDAEVNPLEPEV